MDSDHEFMCDYDSGNESSEDEENFEFQIDQDCTELAVGTRDDEEYKYDVLSTDDIIDHMLESIKEVNSVINLSIPTTRILLNHFKWDKEKLMEKFYGDDQEKLFTDAHIVNPYRAAKAEKPTISATTGLMECEICYLKMPNAMMCGIECGHLFCTACWTEYLRSKIMDEGMGQSISCPAHECGIVVDDQTVVKLLTEPKVKLKYQMLITKSFVECNRLLRWCPFPDCSYAIKVHYSDTRPVYCKCGTCFCFHCGENWHDPVQCNLLKKWIKKCDDDSETSNWIAANTKECPKCKITIEKDGGCNHMICKNSSCKANFCWVCLGPWEPHGSSWYSCNRFDEFEAKEARDAQEKSRAQLQRYLFYCNRYMSHMQSLKFEHKLYAAIRDKMEEMQTHNMSWIEVQFLKKAVDILCSCRETLMFTYIFAYYLVKNNQSAIFEDNQRDVERATETLSEYLERDITQENVEQIKQNVQDKYRYCDQRRRKLLEHVYEGYDKDWWEYSDF